MLGKYVANRDSEWYSLSWKIQKLNNLILYFQLEILVKFERKLLIFKCKNKSDFCFAWKKYIWRGENNPSLPITPTRKVNGQSLTETNVFHLKSIKRVTISGSPKVRYSWSHPRNRNCNSALFYMNDIYTYTVEFVYNEQAYNEIRLIAK